MLTVYWRCLRNDKGGTLCYFLDPMRIKESNETKVLAIREVMKIFKANFSGRLNIESN